MPSFPEFCRKELGIEDVKCGVISDPPFAEASFDAVAMLDVLEHMYDPMGSLTQCARLLKPGGLLVVKSPNGAMQLRKERLKKMLEARRRLRRWRRTLEPVHSQDPVLRFPKGWT